MQFRDQILRCAATGKEFVWTVAEQRERARKGLPLDPPLYCPEVRNADVRLQATDEDAGPVAEAASETGATAGAHTFQSRADADGPSDATAVATEPGPGPGPRGGGERRRKRGGGRPRGGGGRHGRRGGKRSAGPRGAKQTELRVRHTGTVKWFDPDRGFGFIAHEDGGEVFLHATALIVEEGTDLLREGTPVEYEVESTDRGPQAVDVIPLA